MNCSALISPAGMVLAAVLALAAGPAAADKLVYRGPAGKSVELEARVVGTAGRMTVLEMPDGQYKLLLTTAIEKREPGDGPEPMSAEAMAADLQRKFGADRFVSSVQTPFLIGLVLSAPLPRGSEARAANLLQHVGTFMKNVDSAFNRYLKEARIPAQPARYPLVVLIFESRDDFGKYLEPMVKVTNATVSQVGGVYHGMTNYLVLHLDQCRKFDRALHEAIHQQLYNRGVFQRLAPIPKWFDEGIATGFEANQGKINVAPGKISPRYADLALRGTEFFWSEMLVDDDLFNTPDLLANAYGAAWGLHWLLATKYRSQYGEYLRCLAKKKSLVKDTRKERLDDFRQAIGRDPDELQKEFVPVLQAAMRKQKISRPAEKTPGYTTRSDNQGEVTLSVVQVRVQKAAIEQARIETQGTITNLSPLRSLTFRVVMEHSTGENVQWVIPDLGINRSAPLAPRSIPLKPKLNLGAVPDASANTFRLRIESALPGSPEAQRWQAGKAGE